jgi:hypothetical protein
MCGLEFKSNAGLETHIPQVSNITILDSCGFQLTGLSFRIISSRRISHVLDVGINSAELLG